MPLEKFTYLSVGTKDIDKKLSRDKIGRHHTQRELKQKKKGNENSISYFQF